HAYKIISSFDEIDEYTEADIKTIFVILTMEGTNALNTGLQLMGKKVNETEVLTNIKKVKQWDHRMYFVSLTHHFYNELAGHAQSLSGITRKFCDQSNGMNEGIQPLGYKVLHSLLDTSGGKRIL